MVGTPGTMHHAGDSSSRSFAMTPGSAPLGRTPYGMTPGSGLGASDDLDGDDQAQYKHFHACVVRAPPRCCGAVRARASTVARVPCMHRVAACRLMHDSGGLECESSSAAVLVGLC